MQINLQGKNIELTPAIKDYVSKRVTNLEKLLLGIEEGQLSAHGIDAILRRAQRIDQPLSGRVLIIVEIADRALTLGTGV